MFTGCVVEHDGVFHIFYTGHNPANPDGAEIICHATSNDLVTWHKHREHCLGPDGVVYHPRDFRDPFVFRHEEAGEWWMLLCAGLAGSDFSGIARLVSTDLVSWKPAEPLLLDPPLLEGETGAPECPDLFRIGEYWHLLYTRRGQNIRRARHVEGPFTHGVPAQLDNTLLLAGKRLFDGRRHIYFGPLSGDHDDSVMNLPRELFQGDDGHLRVRPVREVVDSFVDVVHESADGGFDLPATGYRCPVPDDYLVRCSLAFAEDAALTIGLRVDADGSGGTPLTVHAGRRSLELGEHQRSWGDAALPVITLQVFVLGTVIECYLDDRLAMVGRTYERRGGYLSIVSYGSAARVLGLEVREAPTPR